MVESLKPFVDYITPCPEADIGLGIPRHPIRIILDDEERKLYQPASDKYFTEKMQGFVDKFLEGIDVVDGFILKNRSPSCGISDVKMHSPGGKGATLGKGPGFFGKGVLQRFPEAAIEDEGRLHNPRIRDHFLKKLFTLAAFRKVTKPKELVNFQARNKLLLMSYDQTEMRELGRIVSRQKELGMDKARSEYRTHLVKAFEKGSTFRNNINVLQHAFGYVSKKLSKSERDFFLDTIEMYREDRVPLETCLQLLRSWVTRFDVEYLDQQTYFEPYPMELTEQFDPYRGSDYWKKEDK